LLAAEHKAQQQAGGSGLGSNSGTFTDKRDGKTYKTVKIGNQTWMAQNLNYVDYEAGRSWCYDDKESNCNTYGRLYDWNTAKAACPSGWHLPTREEWNILVTAAGGDVAGSRLKAAGTDEYGFTALPGGNRGSDGGFYGADGDGYWWTATEEESSLAYLRYVFPEDSDVFEAAFDKDQAFSVRCVGN
jgi:uncharacterized protein (TIGR02145 family)